MGIEPTPPAWKAGALPLSYARDLHPSQRHSDRGPGSIRHANVSLRRLALPFPRQPTQVLGNFFFAGSHDPLAPSSDCRARPPPSSDRTARPPCSGGRRIRTFEGYATRFTVWPLWPLGHSPNTCCDQLPVNESPSMRCASLNDHKMGACWSEDRLTHPEASGGT
jgi:hypothetical protein